MDLPIISQKKKPTAKALKALDTIGSNVTEDNLVFLAELSRHPNINSMLANPLTRIGIKAKLK